MRSQRYKYVRHSASNLFYSDMSGWYPMLMKDGLRPMEIYKWRNQRWLHTVDRWDWRFTSDYDKENFTISNMEYTKKRCSTKYEFK